MSKDRAKNTNWNIPVPKTLDDALEKAVLCATHSTKSDFVRDAVRRRLEEMGFRPQVFEKELLPQGQGQAETHE